MSRERSLKRIFFSDHLREDIYKYMVPENCIVVEWTRCKIITDNFTNGKPLGICNSFFSSYQKMNGVDVIAKLILEHLSFIYERRRITIKIVQFGFIEILEWLFKQKIYLPFDSPHFLEMIEVLPYSSELDAEYRKRVMETYKVLFTRLCDIDNVVAYADERVRTYNLNYYCQHLHTFEWLLPKHYPLDKGDFSYLSRLGDLDLLKSILHHFPDIQIGLAVDYIKPALKAGHVDIVRWFFSLDRRDPYIDPNAWRQYEDDVSGLIIKICENHGVSYPYAEMLRILLHYDNDKKNSCCWRVAINTRNIHVFELLIKYNFPIDYSLNLHFLNYDYNRDLVIFLKKYYPQVYELVTGGQEPRSYSSEY